MTEMKPRYAEELYCGNWLWSEKERDMLMEMYARGMGDEAIGEVLGRTPKSVNVCRQRLGLVGKYVQYTREDERKIARMVKECVPARVIAKEMGVTMPSLRAKMKMLGLSAYYSKNCKCHNKGVRDVVDREQYRVFARLGSAMAWAKGRIGAVVTYSLVGRDSTGRWSVQFVVKTTADRQTAEAIDEGRFGGSVICAMCSGVEVMRREAAMSVLMKSDGAYTKVSDMEIEMMKGGGDGDA